jgi:hypothetical protein
MSESTKPESNADDLTKTTEDGSVNLTEDELGGVSGGPTAVELKYNSKI